MTAHGKRIIAANPSMTAIELHQIAGLSKKDYEELVGENYQPVGSAAKTASPGVLRPSVQMPASAAVNNPVLQALSVNNGNTVSMALKTGGFNSVELNPRIAEKLARKYPNTYKKA